MGGFTQFQVIVGSLRTADDIVVAVITADKALDNAELKLRLADAIIARVGRRHYRVERTRGNTQGGPRLHNSNTPGACGKFVGNRAVPRHSPRF
jgi:hypothetical protein